MSLDQVRSYFGFTQVPFGKSLPPSALYKTAGHQEAVARVSFLVSEQAIGVLTGEVGSGKTVAARAAVAELEPSRHTVVYLPNPAVGARGLYAEVVARLGGEPRFHKAFLIAQVASLLAAESAERGRAIVLVVDEAHLLDSSQLEELRLMTNARWTRLTRSPWCCSANPRSAPACGSAASPLWTNGSRSVTRYRP
jgi:type II secretory pathway predicted ATPase ExeA